MHPNKFSAFHSDLIKAKSINDEFIFSLISKHGLDKNKLIEVAEKSDAIISIEEHTIIGGLGSACAEVILEAGFQSPKKFKRVGIPDTFPLGYGRQNDMMKRQDITVEHLLKSIKSIVG